MGIVTTGVERTVPAGSVISQNPIAGTQVAAGSAVSLVVSTGPPPVSVPSVVNLTQAAATSAITGAGLTVGIVTPTSSASVPAGSVISQDPIAGTQVAAGSAVNLAVSTGPPPVVVPAVVNQTQAAATSAITGAGLVVGTVTNSTSATVPAGSVISQNPSGGSLVATRQRREPRRLNRSTAGVGAQCCQPDAGGGNQRDHGSESDRRNLTQRVECDGARRAVISQNPISGTQVAPGSAVNLVVSTGPPPVSVPASSTCRKRPRRARSREPGCRRDRDARRRAQRCPLVR